MDKPTSPASHASTSTVNAALPMSNEPLLANRLLVVINVATQAPIKLTDTTYFPWHKQFDALLIGYDLYGFIDGTLPCPRPTLSDNSPNPDYTYWVRQDSLLLGAILASLSADMHQLVATTDTSQEAWQKLALSFAKPTRSRLLRLRDRLLRSQANRSISDYLQDVKNAADELRLIDKPVSDDDLTLYILNGLSPAFENISAAFRTRDSPISFEELWEKLLEHNTYINRTNTHSSEVPITAHAATRPLSNRPYSPRSNPSRPFHPRPMAHQPTHPSARRPTSASFPSSYKGRCQLYATLGHSARFCPLLKQNWTFTPKTQQPPPYPHNPQPHVMGGFYIHLYQ